MLRDELLSVAPSLLPYLSAIEEAMIHILNNFHLIQESNSSQILFREAAMIFLSSANITLDDMFSNFSGVNETTISNMIRQAVKMMIDMKIFGNVPMVYQALERFLASNATSLIAQKVNELSAWLASTQASWLDLLTQLVPKTYEIIRPLLSVFTEMTMDIPTLMELFEDLAENIVAMLKQLVGTSGLLAPTEHHQSMFWKEMTGRNQTAKSRHRREALLPTRYPVDDFIDLFYIDYSGMFKAISAPPTTTEMLDTAHMFFDNPNLNIVLKGATSDMQWGLNASREETIDAALGVLSFLTLPSTFQT